MAKRPTAKYDFKAFGQAIKAARTERKESRKKVSDEMYISPRYLANIENKGQQPSLQIFYELTSTYPTIIPIRIDAKLVNPFVPCFNTTITTRTTKPTNRFSREP